MVARPVPADWLALRRRADHHARNQALDLLDLLTTHVHALGADELVVVDVGAGTGSNQAWLAPRLPFRQRWLLVDHDADLLGLGGTVGADEHVTTQRAVATVDDLHTLVHPGAEVLVTCAALLDLLSTGELEALADVVVPAGVEGPAALLSLSVDGQVDLDPAHPSDRLIADAFDAHQRRGDRPGPDAAGVMADALRKRGARVEVRATDWVLGAEDRQLLGRYLDDRAAVAVEHDPGLEPLVRQWRGEREDQLTAGVLSVRVGHLDLLSLPTDATVPAADGAAAQTGR